MVDTEKSGLAEVGRRLIDEASYLTVATADADGTPWATPVWFAHRDYREFVWISSPEAGHSRNLHERAEVALVVFDSRSPVGEGQGVYLAATAEELDGEALDGGIALFSSASTARGGRTWSRADVTAPARHRLYRATAAAAFVNDDHDRRTPVSLGTQDPPAADREDPVSASGGSSGSR